MTELEKITKQRDIMHRGLNQIDDYFEYMNESKRDRDRVQAILNRVTDSLVKLEKES